MSEDNLNCSSLKCGRIGLKRKLYPKSMDLEDSLPSTITHYIKDLKPIEYSSMLKRRELPNKASKKS